MNLNLLLKILITAFLLASGCAQVQQPQKAKTLQRAKPPQVTAPAKQPPHEELKDRMSRLVGQLASIRFEERDSAQAGIEKLLKSRGSEALAELHKAYETAIDLEVRDRLEKLLEPYMRWCITPAVLDAIPGVMELLRNAGTESGQAAIKALAPKLEKMLDQPHSSVTNTAVRLMSMIEDEEDLGLWYGYIRGGIGTRYDERGNPPARRRNIFSYIVLNEPNPGERKEALAYLSNDRRALDVLAEVFSKDIDPEVRAQALVAMSWRGNRLAFDAAVEILKEQEDEKLRSGAIASLANLQNPEAISLLVDVLEGDPDEEIRRDAVHALSWFHSKESADSVAAALLRDKSEVVRASAVEALGSTCWIVNEALISEPLGKLGGREALRAALEDTSRHVRIGAARSLGILRDYESARLLIAVLVKDSDSGVRSVAAEALGKLKAAEAVAPLIGILENPDNRAIWRAAAKALGEIGDKQAIEALAQLLEKDTDGKVRYYAASALASIGGEKTVEPLIKALKDTEPDVQLTAIQALGRPGNSRAVKPLLSIALDNDSYHQQSAAWAIAGIGGKEAFELMSRLLKEHEDAGIRREAAYNLGIIGGKDSLNVLVNALRNDPAGDVRSSVAYAIGKLSDHRAIPALAEALKGDKDASVRWAAAWALGEFWDKKAIPALIEALNDPDEVVRATAATALGVSGEQEVIQKLVQMLSEDKSEYARSSSAFALGRIGTADCLPALVNALENEPGAGVRAITVLGLGETGKVEAVRPLLAVLEDESIDVRENAAYALAQFDMPEVVTALKKASINGNQKAAEALAWMKGPDYFEEAWSYLRNRNEGAMGAMMTGCSTFFTMARTRWGEHDWIVDPFVGGWISMNLPGPPMYTISAYSLDLLSRMPEGFPGYDFKASHATRVKQQVTIWDWFEKYRHRIAWNDKERRYYLRQGSESSQK